MIIQVCRPIGVPVIVNDRVDVAIAADADGVHVGEDDMPLTLARKMIGPLRILGASVKTEAQAIAAVEAGADYLGAGACFSTATKADSTLVGLEGVRRVQESVNIPVVAIGGISHANASQVLKKTGAQGLAVVSSVFDAKDVVTKCKEMREIIDANMAH